MKPFIYKSFGYWRCRVKIEPSKENGFSAWYEQVYLGGFDDIRERLMTNQLRVTT